MLSHADTDTYVTVQVHAEPSVEAGSMQQQPRLSGDGRTLLATRTGGVLLGAFCERRIDALEAIAKPTARPTQKDRKKKGSLRGEAVNDGNRRYPKKNNRRKQ